MDLPTSSNTVLRRALFLVLAFASSFFSLTSEVKAQNDAYPPAPPATTVAPLSPSTSYDSSGGSNSGAAAMAATNNMEVLDNTIKLGNGDTINFKVVEDRDPVITLMITDSGELEVPYIGRVKAAGRTCKELALSIKAALQVDYYYRATVIIGLQSRNKFQGRVYVSGEVITKGPQDIPPNEPFTASNAITRAGGFGRFADKKHIRIIRKMPDGNTQIIMFDWVNTIDKGHIEGDVQLHPGDIINVKPNVINFGG